MKISQREARKLRARVKVLEKHFHDQVHGWRAEWPQGACLGRFSMAHDLTIPAIVTTARRLGNPVIVQADGKDLVMFGVKAELP